MPETLTPNLLLRTPGPNEAWESALNYNRSRLDACAALGTLALTTAEYPSASLNVRVTAGSYLKLDGTVGSFAGATLTVTASTTTFVWLTDVGTLGSGASWPAGAAIRLGRVVSGASSITSILDARMPWFPAGAAPAFVPSAGGVIATDPASGGKVGFFGATPQTQAAAVPDLTDSTGGAADGTLADVGASHNQAVLNNNFADLAAKLNAALAVLRRHGLMAP